jgi:DmsE family decaheme c-type cytochrome
MFARCSAARLPFDEYSRILPALIRLSLLMICAAFLLFSAPTISQTPTATCSSCHADLVKHFSDNPHSRSSGTSQGRAIRCESCHGDGRAHSDNNGDESKILNPANASPKDADASCLSCHASQHPDFAQSAHAKANISCTSCHSIHASKEGKLLKTSQPTLCYQCHAGVQSEFSAPVHHKVDDGPIKCTACHNPHSTFETRLQAAIAQQTAACFKCHTNLAGPWVYEHGAIKQAGCSACHKPHGGSNPKLLNLANVNTICLQCHLPSATVSSAEVNAAHTPTSTQACTSCHVSIHGSNHEDRFTSP